jgi:hypothetical protein
LLTSKASLLLNNSICDFGSLTEEIEVLAHLLCWSTSSRTAKGVIIQRIICLIQLIT